MNKSRGRVTVGASWGSSPSSGRHTPSPPLSTGVGFYAWRQHITDAQAAEEGLVGALVVWLGDPLLVGDLELGGAICN